VKLTEKQKRFVDEYLKDLNASAAARRAGYKAPEIGRRLVTKSHVAAAIAERQKDRQERTEVTQDFVVTNLKTIVERAMDHEDPQYMQAANKALDLLGRHLGMYTDKMTLKGELTVSSVLEELKRRG
jgi:phage terminase small subunit